MARSQIRAKYAGSRLGIWWAVIIPLILAACINLIFTAVFGIKVPNYTIFVLAGIIPWLFFANALTEITNSFITNTSVLRQGIFPREIVPISLGISNLLNFLIGFAIILPIFIIVDLRVAGLLLFLLIVIALQFIFMLGLGLFLSCANVFLRDIAHFLSIGLMIWFWITPVFYSLEMLSFPYRWICLLNPMTYYITCYREILFGAQMPSLVNMGIAFLISITSFAIGYIYFIKKEPSLLKRI
ncbi:MAG: ABC transporter permease [Candidatus Omnitrophica bacterium]|nr:ABC transporter permease [Candidatus Omnitrophota bacterium]